MTQVSGQVNGQVNGQMTGLGSPSANGTTNGPTGPAWVDVCSIDDLVPDRGVCALVGTHQVAIFRVVVGAGADGEAEDELFALSNFDPFSQAFVLSRGIVGSRGDRLKVASPIYKQSFDLRTGQCLDDADVTIATFDVRALDGRVEVGIPSPRALA